MHNDSESDESSDGSDDADESYLPRAGAEQIHLVHDERISVTSAGSIQSRLTQVSVPASPQKKLQVSGLLNPDIPSFETTDFSFQDQEPWQEDCTEFDAEYGPGLQKKGPRELRDSVSLFCPCSLFCSKTGADGSL